MTELEILSSPDVLQDGSPQTLQAPALLFYTLTLMLKAKARPLRPGRQQRPQGANRLVRPLTPGRAVDATSQLTPDVGHWPPEGRLQRALPGRGGGGGSENLWFCGVFRGSNAQRAACFLVALSLLHKPGFFQAFGLKKLSTT